MSSILKINFSNYFFPCFCHPFSVLQENRKILIIRYRGVLLKENPAHMIILPWSQSKMNKSNMDGWMDGWMQYTEAILQTDLVLL